MNRPTTKEIGDEGESLAAAYLESKGWIVLDQNYSFQRAEVDIVAYDQNCIVFVEVKYRSSTAYGYPEEQIDEAKIRNIYKASEAWLYERKMEGSPTRFDVISIVQKGNQAPDITHLEDAFP
ncbi:MAG: YraN family protein [Balneolaceae bacterium]